MGKRRFKPEVAAPSESAPTESRAAQVEDNAATSLTAQPEAASGPTTCTVTTGKGIESRWRIGRQFLKGKPQVFDIAALKPGELAELQGDTRLNVLLT